ncbi:hypothetical protein VNO80_09383 [Phaseolus coccineus]|uniref:NmrA-like domain-containing protein n=1 Tax=Phaseolus coccineus TaxID=3886 RepID=A0AAN9RCF8_PHACN
MSHQPITTFSSSSIYIYTSSFNLGQALNCASSGRPKNLEKVYIPEDQLLKNTQESPFPANFMLALGHAVVVKEVISNHELDPSFGVEASEIYPEVKYTTVDNYLNAFV